MAVNFQPVTGTDVSVRAFLRDDIAPLIEYWTGNSEEFWRRLGVDKAKLRSRDEFNEAYEKSFRETGGVPYLATILLRGRPVGCHTLTHLVPHESAVFHAHIWREEDRRRGIAVYSYLKGAEFFINTLGLKKIIFKTPKLNHGANRVKEKIGIPILGDTIFDGPILISPLPANLYELDAQLLRTLKAKHGI